MKRQSTLNDRATSNDRVRSILAKEERRMKRRASTRSRSALRDAYREAADRIHRVIPKK